MIEGSSPGLIDEICEMNGNLKEGGYMFGVRR